MSGRSGSMPPRLLPRAGAPAGGELDDHPGAVPLQPLLQARELARGRWTASGRRCAHGQWQMLAPASKASCVLSTCSSTEIGTAGIVRLGRGSDPVIATQMMQGFGSDMAAALSCQRPQAPCAPMEGRAPMRPEGRGDTGPPGQAERQPGRAGPRAASAPRLSPARGLEHGPEAGAQSSPAASRAISSRSASTSCIAPSGIRR